MFIRLQSELISNTVTKCSLVKAALRSENCTNFWMGESKLDVLGQLWFLYWWSVDCTVAQRKWHPCMWQRGWNWRSFKNLFNPNLSCGQCYLSSAKDVAHGIPGSCCSPVVDATPGILSANSGISVDNWHSVIAR